MYYSSQKVSEKMPCCSACRPAADAEDLTKKRANLHNKPWTMSVLSQVGRKPNENAKTSFRERSLTKPSSSVVR